MNICIECGTDYDYNPSKPLGASSERCCSCRKKDSEKNKKIILFNIASSGNPMCRKCGYRSSVSAMTLINAVTPIGKLPDGFEDKKKQAEKQFIVCLNCKAELDANEAEFKVLSSKCTPVDVEFYSRKVTVVREKIKQVVTYTDDAIEPEITTDSPKGERFGGEAQVPRRTPTLKMSPLPIDG